MAGRARNKLFPLDYLTLKNKEARTDLSRVAAEWQGLGSRVTGASTKNIFKNRFVGLEAGRVSLLTRAAQPTSLIQTLYVLYCNIIRCTFSLFFSFLK